MARDNDKLPKGDVAIITFLAAVELVESDMWQQYNELGGVNGGNAAYKLALQNLDRNVPQYISDHTDDEMSHATFLNAYLMSKGETPVNLDEFRTLPSSQATGAKQIGRLTNLMNLDVDTSWYTRYRSTQNPDLGGGPFPQAVHIVNQPAIPVNDADTPPNQQQPVPPANSRQSRMQAIANTAGFHFATFEQAGASVYTNLILNVSHQEVLRVLASIVGIEVDHFSVWHEKAGNAVSRPLAGDEPDLSGALRVYRSESAGLLRDSTFAQAKRRRRGDGDGGGGEPTVPRSVAGVLGCGNRPGKGGGCCPAQPFRRRLSIERTQS